MPQAVAAIVGDDGINVLHAEFRTADGSTPRYPAGLPTPVMLDLPTSGGFEERLSELQAGPLGQRGEGVLYGIRGTRLLVYVPLGADDPLADRAHGTAVTASLAGRRTGTSPDALVVFVAGNSRASYEWLADQSWVDLASTSVYLLLGFDPCAGASAVRRMHADGGLLFSSSGNTTDTTEATASPNGLPETYQVGGVDRHGRTWLPPRPEEPEPFFAIANVVRPYETGARFSFPSASGDSLDGEQPFGGTSGASPTVAGYALELVREARRLLGHTGGRTAEAYAVRPPGGPRPPPRGPLADGRFTRDELVELLHVTATPAEPASPVRYALEGFGATTDTSHRLALAVLRGQQQAPDRAAEQQSHDQVEEQRARLMSRC